MLIESIYYYGIDSKTSNDGKECRNYFLMSLSFVSFRLSGMLSKLSLFSFISGVLFMVFMSTKAICGSFQLKAIGCACQLKATCQQTLLMYVFAAYFNWMILFIYAN
jgi:hypothetical protein